MKKSIIVLLLIAFLLVGLFVLTGCGNDKKENITPTATTVPTATPTKTSANTSKDTSTDDYEMKITKNGKTLLVKIKAEGLDYTKSPWVGIVPVGTYKDEAEADEYDVTYTYVDAENYPNIELNIDGIAEGKWLIILCDTDDEGKILATAPITL